MGLVSITQLANGTTADATAVDANFNNIANVLNGNIDATNLAGGTIGASAYADGWTPLIGITPSSVTYNGNRNYSLVFNGVNLTSQISNGMRLKGTRTVTAPTQCTSLNGTTQSFSRASASVNGMTFTTTFSVMGWVKPSAYTQGAVMSRFNGTSGWLFFMDTSGRINVQSGSGGSAVTYQSIPLNKWTHVAASYSSGTVLIYIDGILVPSSGAPTATITQAGNLEVGSLNGGSFFPGKIAQAAVFSAVLNAATIQSYISQGLAGTETSLISAYSFNNSINDLNANANNLTANGSAVATNADSPFAGGANASTAYTAGTTEFGEVFGISFSTNTTVVVQVPDGYNIPTSGGVSAVAYSTQANPLAWPGLITQIGYTQLCAAYSTASTSASNAALGLTCTVYIPAGRKVKVYTWNRGTFSTLSENHYVTVWDGAVGSGTQLAWSEFYNSTANGPGRNDAMAVYSPSAGTHTFNVGFYGTAAGTKTLQAATTNPAYIAVELV